MINWLSLLPPFFGVLLAFLVERLWKRYEENKDRKKFLQGIKKELELCAGLLVRRGNLLPTDMWKSGISAGLLKLIPYQTKIELTSIYFRIDCHNNEAEKVRQVSILAATTKEKPKATIDAKLGDQPVKVETPWTNAELLHSTLSVRLKKEEKNLRDDINKLLKQNIWDCSSSECPNGLKSKKTTKRKISRASALIWFLFFPLLIVILMVAWMFPSFLVSCFPQTQIQSYGFPPHAESTLELKLAINDINPDFCTFSYTMRYRVEVNYTVRADFHMLIIPKGNGTCGIGVPFDNLKYDGISYTFNATSWTDYNTYSHSGAMTLPIPYKSPEQFPADTYVSSTIYVWFSEPVYPKVKINLYSSIPKSSIVSIKELGLVTPDTLYEQFDIGDKLFVGKPLIDVLAFQILVQRDRPSLILYSAYVLFIALMIYYSATLSRIASIELSSKLQMFVGLSIAVIAFLWSVRPVVGTITFVEVGLMFGLFVWLLIEISDWYRKS